MNISGERLCLTTAIINCNIEGLMTCHIAIFDFYMSVFYHKLLYKYIKMFHTCVRKTNTFVFMQTQM